MPVTKRLYFAYGSNMDQDRLESRIGKVKKLGVHTLAGWRLAFNCGFNNRRFANITADATSIKDAVEGVLYEVTPKQLKILDGFEGFPWAYNRVLFGGPKEQAMNVYVCLNPHYKPHPKVLPTEEYMHHVIKGCMDNNMKITLARLNEMKRRGIVVF